VTPFEERIGHRFRDGALLARALTHRSAADPRKRMLDSNERLEFLGDRVLGLLMAEWLAERFPQEREGDLGKRLGLLCAQETIAPIAESLGIAEALTVPPAEGRTGLRARATVLSDALEAVLGAIYLDAGLEPARALVRREWEAALAAPAKPPASAKNRLQEWTLGKGRGLPEYRLVSQAGPAHQPVFVVAVTAAGREAEGMGDSKRAAELAAAENWLAGMEQ